MKTKLLFVLLLTVSITAFAQTYKIKRQFSASVYVPKDSCFKDTTASALIEVEDGKLKALYLFPLGLDKNITYKHAQLISTYSGAYPFSIPGLQSAVRRAEIGSF